MLVKYSERPGAKWFEGAIGVDLDDFTGAAGLYQPPEPNAARTLNCQRLTHRPTIDKNDRKFLSCGHKFPKRLGKHGKNRKLQSNREKFDKNVAKHFYKAHHSIYQFKLI